MTVFELLPESTVKTLNGKVCVTLTLARDGKPCFLMCLDEDEAAELRRQVVATKLDHIAIIKTYLTYGVTSVETLKKMGELVHGNRSNPY